MNLMHLEAIRGKIRAANSGWQWARAGPGHDGPAQKFLVHE